MKSFETNRESESRIYYIVRPVSWKRPYMVFVLLVASIFLLGSSVTFCETGDVYNRSYDLTHDFSSRWYGGKAQLTPRWTPDDSHIVFGYAGRIFIVDAGGSDLKSLSGSFEPLHVFSETTEIDFSPSLSPDGSKVAYSTLRYATGELSEHTYEIATQAINGLDRQRLTNNNWNEVSPSWSPDGSRIAYVSYREEGPRVYMMMPDGSDKRNIAPSVESSFQPPVWSSDGSRLAFLAIEREPTEVPYLDTYYSNATPTPSTYKGHLIRFVAYTVETDGFGLTKLEWTNDRSSSPRQRIGISDLALPEETVSLLSWSPDGQKLAFTAGFYGEPDHLYIANLNIGQVQQILDLSTILKARQYYHSAYGNIEGSIQGIAWSPDGSQIVFEVGGHRLVGDTLQGRSSLFTIASNGSDFPLLLDEADGDYVTSYAESYLEWPVALVRGVLAPRQGYSPPSVDYLQKASFLIEYAPARIIMNLDSQDANVSHEVEGWVLTINSWGESDEIPLVRIAGDRLVAMNP